MLAYMIPNIWWALFAKEEVSVQPPQRLAVCLRFRDEARYLREWLDYYLAAGVDHFFLYNNFSEDDYLRELHEYIGRGVVTLVEWPRIPASPAAENDCILRAKGRFQWVGFLDADEFVVVADGASIPDFLDRFPVSPAVALNWYYFGSSGHVARPAEPVLVAYPKRDEFPNRHFKVFVRPEAVTRNRNPHNFYYRKARCAVSESGVPVYGSLSGTASAECAWINHYVHKSLEDYLAKARRKATHDRAGMKHPARTEARAAEAMRRSNDVIDSAALVYLQTRISKLVGDEQ